MCLPKNIHIASSRSPPPGLGGDYIHVDSLPTSSSLGSFSDAVAVTELGNQYRFSNLVTGRSYHFYLDICNGVGCTASNVLGPVPIASAPGRPPRPTLKASAAAPTPKVEINLFSPDDNGGSPITGLQIHKDDGKNGLLSPWMTVGRSPNTSRQQERTMLSPWIMTVWRLWRSWGGYVHRPNHFFPTTTAYWKL